MLIILFLLINKDIIDTAYSSAIAIPNIATNREGIAPKSTIATAK